MQIYNFYKGVFGCRFILGMSCLLIFSAVPTCHLQSVNHRDVQQICSFRVEARFAAAEKLAESPTIDVLNSLFDLNCIAWKM